MDLAMVRTEAPIETSCPLGNGIYVTVTAPYPVVHIRYWRQKDGKTFPTRDGIVLRDSELEHFQHMKDQIAHASSCFIFGTTN